MIVHDEIDVRKLRGMIRKGEVIMAGNTKLKIYGLLSCASGKRMMRRRRVFFADVEEAVRYGFRPCGRCLPAAYKVWKENVKPDE